MTPSFRRHSDQTQAFASCLGLHCSFGLVMSNGSFTVVPLGVALTVMVPLVRASAGKVKDTLADPSLTPTVSTTVLLPLLSVNSTVTVAFFGLPSDVRSSLLSWKPTVPLASNPGRVADDLHASSGEIRGDRCGLGLFSEVLDPRIPVDEA